MSVSVFSMIAPSRALAAAASRMGLPLDRDALEVRFDRHATPSSLRALVEIAPEFGLAARAFRSDVEGLAEAALPAIVHVVDPAADESGFAILVERGADRFVLEEGDGAERHVLTREAFESCWSGVVVTLAPRERDAPAPKLRHGGLRLRLRAWYRRQDPITLASSAARLGGCAAGAALALVYAWRAGFDAGGGLGAAAACLITILAGVGAASSVALFHRSRRSLVPIGGSRLSGSICGRGKFSDCLGVLASRYSRVAGIDWGSIGVAFFSANLLLMAVGALLGEGQRLLLSAWLSVAYLLALPGSLALIAVQVYPLRRFCPLCMAVHGIVLISAALGGAHLATGAWPRDPAALAPYAIAHVVALLGAFGLLVPYLILDLESRVSRARLGWIGSTPLGALAEAAGRPRAVAEMPPAPVRIGEPSAPFRMDALVHPMCAGCGSVVSKLLALAERRAGQVSIGLHFPPRDVTSRGDHELCALLSAVGLVAGGRQGIAAFQRVKSDAWPMLRAAGSEGAESLVGEFLPDDGVRVTAETWSAARAAVEAADRLAETLERGTPTLLINGRFWDGSVDDLDALMRQQPDQLAAVLRASARAASAGPA